jgi:tRNA(fMet)-specific endonuclease VapC
VSRYLLDTNILSTLINGRGRNIILTRIGEVGSENVCTSIIVAAEIRYGVFRRYSPRLVASADQVLGAIDVLPFERPAETAYGKLRAELEQRGATIGPNDLLIAAQCLAVGLTLVTNNLREFRRVDGLRIEDWSA